MPRCLQKTIVIVLFAVGLTIFTTIAHFEVHFSEARPRQPEPITGYVYRVSVNHGNIVYVSRSEKLWLDYEFTAGMVSIVFTLAAVLLDRRWNTGLTKRSSEPPTAEKIST